VNARALTAAAGLLLLASLWTTWGFDREAEPDAPLTAWQAFPAPAGLLAALALVAVGAAVVAPPRRGALLAAGAGALAVVDVVALLVLSNPARGARVALLAAFVVPAAAGAWAFGTLPGNLNERWQAVPRALLARIVMGAGGALMVIALWATWGAGLDAWGLYRATDMVHLVLALITVAAAVAGRRAGAVAGGAAAALVAANTARLIVAGAPTTGTQLSLLGSSVAVLAAAALIVETLPGDPVERWRAFAPDPVLRVLTAAGAAGLLLPYRTWREASWPLLGLLAVATVTGLVSAALRPSRTAAALGAAAGGVAFVAIYLTFAAPGFHRVVEVALLSSGLIAASAAARAFARHPGDACAQWRDVGHAGLAVVRSSWLWAVLVTASVYPFVFTVAPGVKLDESWIIGLYLAAGKGWNFGSDIVFTYGPLGYLTVPRFVSAGLFAEAVVYVISAYFAAAFALVATARRTFGLIPAILVTAFTLNAFRIVSPEESTQVAAASATLLAAAALLHSESVGRSRRWWWIIAALGFVAAFHTLLKLNAGVLIVLLVGLGVVGGAPPGRRIKSVGVLAAVFSGSLLVLWLVLDQDLGALPGYLAGSYEVVRGFPEAMPLELGEQQTSNYVWAGLVTAGIASVTAWSARSLGWWRGLALCGAIAVFVYSWFKQGFVRHELGHHVLMFFAVAVPAVLAAAQPRARARGYGGVMVAGAAAALALAAFVLVSHIDLRNFHATGTSLAGYRQLVALLGDPEPAIERQRALVRAVEAVDPEALRLLQGRTVHVAPFEAAVAWAHPDLRWRPLPTMQDYLGYTPALDRLNVEALTDDRRAPERILRAPREYRPTESPRATLEVLCRYREVYASQAWQVLARVANRCGPVVPFQEEVRVPAGGSAPVPVPAPDEAILFTVEGLELSPLERVRSLLWKSRPRYLNFGGSAMQTGPEMASVPTLVKVGEGVDYPGGPFGTAAAEVSGSVTTDGVTGPAVAVPRPLTVRFYKVRLKPA
jgi:hypothetical protein